MVWLAVLAVSAVRRFGPDHLVGRVRSWAGDLGSSAVSPSDAPPSSIQPGDVAALEAMVERNAAVLGASH